MFCSASFSLQRCFSSDRAQSGSQSDGERAIPKKEENLAVLEAAVVERRYGRLAMTPQVYIHPERTEE